MEKLAGVHILFLSYPYYSFVRHVDLYVLVLTVNCVCYQCDHLEESYFCWIIDHITVLIRLITVMEIDHGPSSGVHKIITGLKCYVSAYCSFIHIM